MEKNLESGPGPICSTCGFVCSNKHQLKVHIRNHVSNIPYICQTCGKGFTLNSLYKNHYCVSVNRHECHLCGKVFSLKATLSEHLIIHAREKPYRCAVCDKSFFCRLMLNRHFAVHDPWKCELCAKRKLVLFQTHVFACMHCSANRKKIIVKGSLKGGHRFQCGKCERGFDSKKALTHHILVHLGLKPFKCNLCMKLFSLRDSLIAHVAIHNKIYRYR